MAYGTTMQSSKVMPPILPWHGDNQPSPVVATPGGVTWAMISQSGRENSDSAIGLYAGDAASYHIFWEQFQPVIARYHQIAEPAAHRWQPAHALTLPNALGHFPSVLSTRLRVARNLAGFRFPAAMSAVERHRLYSLVKELLQTVPGTFYDLATLSSAQTQALARAHMLFTNQDRFMASAHILDHWPVGRAIFVAADGCSRLWLNEEDHLRIFSIAEGYAIPNAVAALTRLLTLLDKKHAFARSTRLGYLTSCPTNLEHRTARQCPCVLHAGPSCRIA